MNACKVRLMLTTHLFAVLIFIGLVAPCHAVEWGYVFVPAAIADAQGVINQVFANGLRPRGTGSGRNGIDLWNYLARPDTNPLFITAYRNWDAVRTFSDRSDLNGALFEVALDDNFYRPTQVLDSLSIAITTPSGVGMNDDIFRLLENIQNDWRRQGDPVTGITGFDGGHIVNTSINGAWIVDRGQLQNLQPHAAYQTPATNIRIDTSGLFDGSLAYERLDPQVETVRSSAWVHALAVFYCFAYGKPRLSSRLVAGEDGCRHPTILTVQQFNREESSRHLPASVMALLLD